MSKMIGIIAVGLFVFGCQFAIATTRFVDDSVPVSGDGQSWETAYKTIQEGIDAASSGDIVVVAEGTYVENIRWPGQTISHETFDAYTNLYTHDDVVDAGWTVVNGSGDPNGAWRLWSTTGEPLRAEAPNIAAMTQNYMIADSDLASEANLDEELITPEIDCRSWQNVRLTFNKNFRVYAKDTYHLQVGEVDIRVFHEGTGWGAWANLLHYDALSVADYDTAPEDVNLTKYADRRRIQIRWHFFDATNDWWFAIDDVTLSGEPLIKNIILRSKDPLDLVTVANTVIDGAGKGPAVTFSGAEDETCVLSGFTIRNGNAERGGGICGGTWPSWTHATIQNNVIIGNSATYGGGLAYCHGAVLNNIVAGNSAGESGGGLFDCVGTLQNNTIYANSSAGFAGSALVWCSGTIRNCIIWANVDPMMGPQLSNSAQPTYSCIQGWEQGGVGNISAHPHLVDPQSGDYHLQTWSPCIDAGDPSSHFSKEPLPNGGRINMGAYGNTPGATSASEDTDEDGLPDDWEMHFFGDLAQGPSDDPEGDGRTNLDEYVHATNPASRVLWYVDGSVAASGDGTSWQTAFKKIQDGIDAASDGDTVIVAVGNYVENIKFNGKNIILTSTNPLDPDIVADTIIDGNKAGSVVAFSGTENDTCVLSGFTIRNGEAPEGGPFDGGFGGGICGGVQFLQNNTHATIRNNVITGNSAYRGGGIALCDGLIHNNTIRENSAGRGGAMRYCHGTIENNIITGNTSTGEGAAGLDHCDGIIQNNIISENSGLYGDSEGGLNGCNGIIQNNLISGNSCRGYTAGLTFCLGMILNNTIVDNSVTGGEAMAGGLAGCGGIIRNCIIWGNSAPDGLQLSDCSEPAYCCIQNWTGGGTGNTREDPLFVDADGGDYHVRLGSPCVNKGVNYYWAAWPQRDFDGNCRLEGERVDMGCYEYDSFVDSDGDLLEDDDERDAGTDPADSDTDDDGLRDGLELLRGSNPLTLTPPGTVRLPADFPTIQIALCLALNGDEIILAPGTYRENLQFCGPDVVLRSSDPQDLSIVASTVLDGGAAGPVVSFTGRESETCVLSGFTIRNGSARVGGGIYGGTEENPTRATIQHNAITANSASTWGGGLAFCGGAILGNTISGNSASSGGGLYMCGGDIHDNVVSRNRAASDGGGLYDCRGVIRNNTIIGNYAGWGGGGMNSSGSKIENCIIWGNTASREGAQLQNCVVPFYSCVQNWTGDPVKYGNTASDPQFARPGFWDVRTPEDKSDDLWVEGDYRLSPGSPCIDKGDNAALPLDQFDIVEMHRIMFGGKSLTVDMGAYEFYINDLALLLGADQAIVTWSSLADKTYSIFYSDDLLTWHLAIENVPSSGDETTFWTDDGSVTGVAPLLVPRRFYRVLENP